MKYLATIKFDYDSSSMMFKTQKEAEQWLETQNNNLEHTTFITIYDAEWNVVDKIYYTEREE